MNIVKNITKIFALNKIIIWILFLTILLIAVKIYYKPSPTEQQKTTITFKTIINLPQEATYDTVPQLLPETISDNLPQEITIYKLNKVQSDIEKIAQKFNFQESKKINEDPKVGTQIYWTNQNSSLIWNPTNYLLEYQHNLLLDASPLEEPAASSSAVIIKKMQSLLFDLNYNMNINSNNFKYIKIVNNVGKATTDQNNADVIEVSWQSNINGYNIKAINETRTINTILAAKSGKILAFSINLLTPNSIPLGEVKLKTKEQIIKEVDTKKATLNSINLTDIDQEKNAKPIQIKINNLTLEYYHFKTTNEDSYLIPIYILPATATLNTEEQTDCELSLPALIQ